MQSTVNLDLSALAWGSREVIMVSIIVVLVYMLWQLVQMLRLTLGLEKKRVGGGLLDSDVHWAVEDKNFRPPPSLGNPFSAVPPLGLQREINVRPLVPADNPPDFMRTGPVARKTSQDRGVSPLESAKRGWQPGGTNKPLKPAAGPAYNRPSFAESTFIQGVELELGEIRDELTGVRKDLNTLKKEWETELSQMRMTHSSSPVYSDAMQLAVQGFDAATIAERCDIPPGEASLVVALVGKKRQRA